MENRKQFTPNYDYTFATCVSFKRLKWLQQCAPVRYQEELSRVTKVAIVYRRRAASATARRQHTRYTLLTLGIAATATAAASIAAAAARSLGCCELHRRRAAGEEATAGRELETAAETGAALWPFGRCKPSVDRVALFPPTTGVVEFSPECRNSCSSPSPPQGLVSRLGGIHVGCLGEFWRTRRSPTMEPSTSLSTLSPYL